MWIAGLTGHAVNSMGRWSRFRTKKNSAGVDRAVRSLVRDAYRRVPLFHARLDDAGFQPDRICTAKDLRMLPITTREAYLSGSRSQILRAGTNPDRCHRARTSGTTGTPLIVHLNRYEALFRRLLLFNALRKNAHLSVPLSVADIGVNTVKKEASRGDVTQSIGLVLVTGISRFLTPREQADRLLRTSPQVITGAPSCLELVAEELQRRSQTAAVRPKLVAPRGEVLQPLARALLEEVGNIAWECPAQTGLFHINTAACIVEIVDAEGQAVSPGTEGSVVLTNLFNWTMPFIRYALGDRATLLEPVGSRCACGHEGPSMAALAGRADDFITLPSGDRVSPRTVIGLICSASRRSDDKTAYHVRRYRVDQDSLDHVRVRIVPEHPLSPDLGARIALALRGLSPDLRCDVEMVAELPPEDSAKFRIVTSHVRSPGPRSGD